MQSVPDPVQRAWLGAESLLMAIDAATQRLLAYEPCELLPTSSGVPEPEV